MNLWIAVHDSLQVLRRDVVPREVSISESNDKPVI